MYTRILESLAEVPLLQVQIGLNWTAVVVEKGGVPRCGLAATLALEHDHTAEADIPAPGRLEEMPALELAGWIESDIPLRRSLGCAAINALLDHHPASWIDQNAEQAMLEHGRGKKAVLIGHFPFAERLRDQFEDFKVLDLHPKGAVLPASAAPDVLPQADLVAITGMAFINRTLPGLLDLCRQDAYVLILGPSTPLTPLWADYGVDLLAGSIVEDIPAVLAALAQGATFRQLHRQGVRLITMKP